MPEEYKDSRINNMLKKIELEERSEVGHKYIDFTGKDLEGKAVKLSEYIGKNKYTLIDFWASWCSPCCAEMPMLKKIYNKYHKKGFNIIGISLDSDPAKWKESIKRLELPWHQI